MTHARILFFVLLTLCCRMSWAASEQTFSAKTSGDLVKLCQMPVDDPWYDLSIGFCLGYISSAQDYHAAISSGDLVKPVTCPTGQITRQDVLDAFLAWAAKNPDVLDSEKPIQGLMRSASEKWPCK